MKIKQIIIIALSFLILALPAYAQEGIPQAPAPQQQMPTMPVEPPEMDQEFAQELVATVNEQDITMKDLDEMFFGQLVEEISQNIDQSFAELLYTTEAGQNLLKEYAKTVIDDLIVQILVEQEIEKKDIDIVEAEKQEFLEEIRQQIEMMKSQYEMSEEELVQQLGMQMGQQFSSLKQLEDFIWAEEKFNIKVQKLLDKEVYNEIHITDEEAREMFEEQPEQFVDLESEAPFEDVKEQVKEQMQQKEKQSALNIYLDDLELEAKITIHL